MTDQPRPTLSRVPIAPCPDCGATAPMRPAYGPVGVWYRGNCGWEYPRPTRGESPRRSRIGQRPASEEWP